jgi:hypothetical protein
MRSYSPKSLFISSSQTVHNQHDSPATYPLEVVLLVEGCVFKASYTQLVQVSSSSISTVIYSLSPLFEKTLYTVSTGLIITKTILKYISIKRGSHLMNWLNSTKLLGGQLG